MLNLREMLDIFTGRAPVESFANRRIDIAAGIASFAAAFFLVAFLFTIEFGAFKAITGFMAAESLVNLFVAIAIIVFLAVVLSLVSFLAIIIFLYVWGAIHFFIAKFFSNKPQSLNDFNGAWFGLFGSVVLVEGLVALVPILGWVIAIAIKLYGVVLSFRFVKSRFNLSDAQAAIVVLLPFDLAMLGLVIISGIASFILISPKIL